MTESILPLRGPRPPKDLPPFLTIPFERHGARKISEGYRYSRQEHAIHGHDAHYGIDFEAAFGSPVYAPCAGWVTQGYHLRYLTHLVDGRPIGFGLGKFVQLIVRDLRGPLGNPISVIMAHLSAVEPGIPFFTTKEGVQTVDGRTFRGWSPTNLARLAPSDALREVQSDALPSWHVPGSSRVPTDVFPFGVKQVAAGQLLGNVGTSGLPDNCQELPDGTRNGTDDPWNLSWDEPHLHLEVFERDDVGAKAHRWDPFGIYSSVDDGEYNRHLFSPDHTGLWLTGANGCPRWRDG